MTPSERERKIADDDIGKIVNDGPPALGDCKHDSVENILSSGCLRCYGRVMYVAMKQTLDELTRKDREHAEKLEELESFHDEELRKAREEAYEAGFMQGWHCAHQGKVCGPKDHPYEVGKVWNDGQHLGDPTVELPKS